MRYGYRDGLSDDETRIVSDNTELRATLKSLAFNHTAHKASYNKRLTKDKFPLSDSLTRSQRWAEGKAPVQCATSPGPQRVEELLRTLSQQDRIYQEEASLPPESCLLDTWVGNRRVGFIDLAAGPFEWGPVVGGEGLRTKASLPNVSMFVANVTGALACFSLCPLSPLVDFKRICCSQTRKSR